MRDSGGFRVWAHFFCFFGVGSALMLDSCKVIHRGFFLVFYLLYMRLHVHTCTLAELALQGARLRFYRAYLAFQAPTCQAGMTFGTSSIGFDPADSAQYAVEAAPILGPWRPAVSPPSGARNRIGTYSLFAVAALCFFLSCFRFTSVLFFKPWVQTTSI